MAKASHWKKPEVPVAVERELERLRERVKELERVGKLAHDTLADIAGFLGPSFVAIDIDGRCFRELVRVLFIDK
jgi:hypothetical protein